MHLLNLLKTIFLKKYFKKFKVKKTTATRIINGEQFSGCIMQPHYFIVIRK